MSFDNHDLKKNVKKIIDLLNEVGLSIHTYNSGFNNELFGNKIKKDFEHIRNLINQLESYNKSDDEFMINKIKKMLNGKLIQITEQLHINKEYGTFVDEQNVSPNQLSQTQIIKQNLMNYDLAKKQKEIKDLSNELIELSEIFIEINTIIHQQGNDLDDIESNLIETNNNVQKGNVELKKTSLYKKSMRIKYFFCFLILIIVITIIIIALIISLNK